MLSRITALAAATGNRSALRQSLDDLKPAEAICWLPITPIVTKSPMTIVTTKIEPMTMLPVERHDHRPLKRSPA